MPHRKSVLIVYGVDGWAWHHMARGIVKYAPDDVSVTLASNDMLAAMSSGQSATTAHDYILFLGISQAGPQQFCREARRVVYLANMGIGYRESSDDDWRSWIVTEARNQRRLAAIIRESDRVILCNPRLETFRRVIGKPYKYLPSGVDLDLFSYSSIKRQNMVRVGWCGDASLPASGRGVKGYAEVCVPLARSLSVNSKIRWTSNINNYHSAISHDKMAAWYRSLNIFICTSISEGSPMTVLEAAACGVPIVSTAVGVVPEITPIKDRGFLIDEYHNEEGRLRAVEQFREKIQTLADNPAMAYEYGQELRQFMVDNHSWKTLAPKWLEYVIGG